MPRLFAKPFIFLGLLISIALPAPSCASQGGALAGQPETPGMQWPPSEPTPSADAESGPEPDSAAGMPVGGAAAGEPQFDYDYHGPDDPLDSSLFVRLKDPDQELKKLGSYAFLSGYPNIKALILDGLDLPDEPIPHIESLEDVTLYDPACGGYNTADILLDNLQLKEIVIYNPLSLDGLNLFSGLEYLQINYTNPNKEPRIEIDFLPLSGYKNTLHFSIDTDENSEDVALVNLESCVNIHRLRIWIPDLKPEVLEKIACWESLDSLDIAFSYNITTLQPLRKLKSLRCIYMSHFQYDVLSQIDLDAFDGKFSIVPFS